MRLAPAFAESGQAGRRPLGRLPPRRRRVPALVRLRAHGAGVARARALRAAGALRRARRERASLVANPGCYPTAALLALAPLVRAGLVEPTGHHRRRQERRDGRRPAGERGVLVRRVRRTTCAPTSSSPTSTRRRSRAALVAVRAGRVKLTFTAHLLPVKRGLIATCYARPAPGHDAPRASPSASPTRTRARAFVRAMRARRR